MEVSQGPQESPGAPISTEGVLGVVGSHQPHTPGNQALEAMQASTQPNLDWLRAFESTQGSPGAAQAPPQAEKPQQAFATGPADQLLSGLRNTVQEPIGSGMTVAEAPSNGPNPYKRAHVGTGVENDTPGISGLVKEHCKDLPAPIIRERIGLKATIKDQAGLIESLRLRVDCLERAVQALEATKIVTPRWKAGNLMAIRVHRGISCGRVFLRFSHVPGRLCIGMFRRTAVLWGKY